MRQNVVQRDPDALVEADGGRHLRDEALELRVVEDDGDAFVPVQVALIIVAGAPAGIDQVVGGDVIGLELVPEGGGDRLVDLVPGQRPEGGGRAVDAYFSSQEKTMPQSFRMFSSRRIRAMLLSGV